MKKVAVQKGLNPVKSYLHQEGYNVREFDATKKNVSNYLNKFDAVILTGESSNVMGVQNTSSSSTFINADGLTPRDIKDQLEKNNIVD
ncbi:YkuS family protein [Clostridium sp.]|uniref:YkuS family protein n=1 Tax=Clostridium sp. TaxID=1506 RepID=UPI002FCBBCEB